MEKSVIPPSVPTARHTLDPDIVGFGNVLVKPEPGPQPSAVLLLQYAMPSERLDREQLQRLKEIIDALLEPP